ncbi:hypothetical protein PG984_009135 [Apiospora sp. TS-2023a]
MNSISNNSSTNRLRNTDTPQTPVYPPPPLEKKHRHGMCIAIQYVYQCYSCHSTVIKDLHHGPRYACSLVMTTGAGLGSCSTGLMWNSHRRRCCDDIDPRAAADSNNSGQGDEEYRYFLLRSEKLCLFCETQHEIRQLGIHAESEVLDCTTGPTTSPTPSSPASNGWNLTACGCSAATYWGEADHRRRYHHRQEANDANNDGDDDSDDDDDEEGGAPL